MSNIHIREGDYFPLTNDYFMLLFKDLKEGEYIKIYPNNIKFYFSNLKYELKILEKKTDELIVEYHKFK